MQNDTIQILSKNFVILIFLDMTRVVITIGQSVQWYKGFVCYTLYTRWICLFAIWKQN